MLALGSIQWWNRSGRRAAEKAGLPRAGRMTEALSRLAVSFGASDAGSSLFNFQCGPQKLDENRSGDKASPVPSPGTSPRGCVKPRLDDPQM